MRRLTKYYFIFIVIFLLKIFQLWFEILVRGSTVYEKVISESELYENVKLYASKDEGIPGHGVVFFERMVIKTQEGWFTVTPTLLC